MPFGASRLAFLAKTAAAAATGRTAKTFITVKDPEISTAQSKFGGSSALFQTTGQLNGTSDCVRTNAHSDFIFTGDFTWECWVYMVDNGTSDGYILMANRGGFNATNLYVQARQSDNKWQWGNSTMGANITSQTWNYNTWYHVAVVRNGNGANNFALYVNGSRLQRDSDTNTIGSAGYSDYISMGSIYNASTPTFGLNGYLDEVRVSPIARYTGSSYTVPTAPFVNDDDTVLLVHMDGANGSTTFTDDVVTPLAPLRTALSVTAYSNAQIDTAQNQFGGSSLSTSRSSSDYISIDNTNDELALGSGDFTVEFWHRTSSIPGGSTYYFIYDSRITGSGTSMSVGITNQNFFVYAAGAFRVTSNTNISTNTWYHVAIVKNGGTTTMYQNGSNVGSYSDSFTYVARDDVRLGANFSAANGANGHTDEFRISDTARYTSNFTPSTTPFINDTDTLLLLHMDGTDGSTTFTDDNGKGRAQQRVGFINQAQISTAQSKFGVSSAYFDGNDDVVAIGDDTDSSYVLWPRTGIFTVELWAKPADTSFQQLVTVYGAFGDSNPAGRSWIGIDGSNKWTFSANGGPTIASSSNASTTAWTHLAIVRNGSNQFEFFVDGVSQGTSTSSYTLASGYVSLAANANSYGLDYEGYIDEFRISNSVRYTGNFTPSTSAFTNDADTLVLLHFDGANGSTDTTDDNGVY